MITGETIDDAIEMEFKIMSELAEGYDARWADDHEDLLIAYRATSQRLKALRSIRKKHSEAVGRAMASNLRLP